MLLGVPEIPEAPTSGGFPFVPDGCLLKIAGPLDCLRVTTELMESVCNAKTYKNTDVIDEDTRTRGMAQ